MRRFNFLFLIPLCFLAFGCTDKKGEQKRKVDEDYFRGSLMVLADDAYASVGKALADGYSYQYPEARISIKTIKENQAVAQLLNGQAEAILLSRHLNDSEQKMYTRQAGQDYKPAAFAADAVVFVSGKNSTRNSISIDEIKKMARDPAKPLIFDGANAGNLNFVAEKLQIKPKQMQFSVLPGNSNVAENIGKYPNSVGVISLGTFSRPYDPKSIALRQKLKILSISVGNQSFLPKQENLANLSYPFTRIIYMLTIQRGFKLAGGLMRYASSQTGQLIVEKEGLQPYYLYKRTVQMR